MNQLKGFFIMPALASTTTDTAIFGDLSVYASTFNPTTREYALPAITPNTELTVFKLTDVDGNTVNPTQPFITKILQLGNWLYGQFTQGSIPQNSNKAALVQSILAEFVDINSVEIGHIVSGSRPVDVMPDYVKFTLDDGDITYQCQVWCCDASFRAQYDEYKITIIPPVPDLATLREPTSSVLTAVNGVTPAAIIAAANTIIGNKPPTKITEFPITWHDVGNTNSTIPVSFTAVVYGQAGLSADAIESAITAYIAQNSTATNWAAIFPSLYAESEFAIIPLWEELAVSNNQADMGIYSPVATVGDLMTTAVNRLPAAYTQETNATVFEQSNLSIFSTTYRSMLLMSIGNPNNTGSVFAIKSLFPDYIAVSSTSADFNRMSLPTQTFVLKLLNALEEARTYILGDPSPAGFNITTRSGRLYITFNLAGYTFMVLTRSSYDV